MKENNIKSFKLVPNKVEKGKTDWARVDSMTEDELHNNALSDPDNPPLTDEELRLLRRIHFAEPVAEEIALKQA